MYNHFYFYFRGKKYESISYEDIWLDICTLVQTYRVQLELYHQADYNNHIPRRLTTVCYSPKKNDRYNLHEYFK